jgi:hypothetical protein
MAALTAVNCSRRAPSAATFLMFAGLTGRM